MKKEGKGKTGSLRGLRLILFGKIAHANIEDLCLRTPWNAIM